MTGTIVNAIAVMIGGIIGVTAKRFIKKEIQEILLHVVGVCVIIIGINGLISTMFVVDPIDGRLSSSGGVLLMASLVVGVVIGEYLKLDARLSAFGKKVEQKLKLKSNFSHAFIEASILYCVGAMAIVGAINEGVYGDSSFLLLKSSFDFVTSIILACSLGIGVSFSAISIFAWQGALTLSAKFIAQYVPDYFINNVSMIGYAIVLCIGINFLIKTKIKIANTIPAIVVAFFASYFF